MTIWFDMDGTIADLYGIDNWLERIINEDPSPYMQAKPLVRMSALAKRLNALQRKGIRLGVISWGSKDASDDFMNMIITAKLAWLHRHLPSVTFDEVHIVPYGTPKSNYQNKHDFLFDDEERNLIDWGFGSFTPDKITKVLAEIDRFHFYN